MANTLRGTSQVCGLMNNEADATSKLSRGAKAESTRISVGIIGDEERTTSIDRPDQIRTADAVPPALELCLW
jgi:hypothetical protein